MFKSKTLTTVTFVFLSNLIFSQSVDKPQLYRPMLNTDVFIIDLKTDSVNSGIKIKINFGNGNKYYKLYSIKIDTVYFNADSLHVNKKDLIGSKLLLVPSDIILPKETKLFASIFATSKTGIFIWSRFLYKKDINFKDLHYSSIVRSVDFNSRKLNKYIKNKH
jgi:hypothetical protein